METLLAQVVNGIAIGSTYATLVAGLNLMLLVAGVFQYSYPHIIVLSMYVYFYALQITKNNLILSILITLVASIVISVATEPLFRPAAKKQAGLATFMIALGIAMLISDMQSKRIHSGYQIYFPSELGGDQVVIKTGMIVVSLGQLLVIIGSIVSVAVFLLILNHTRQGRAFRAIAQDPFSAKLVGIPILKTTYLAYVIAGILGGITAIFLAMSLRSAGPGLGDRLALKIFSIALFAGLGNLNGGLIAAIIIGIIESVSLGYISGRWVDAVVFAIIIVTVIIKPRGLFGSKV
jgi:branched-chain amino acid transport system permease protein